MFNLENIDTVLIVVNLVITLLFFLFVLKKIGALEEKSSQFQDKNMEFGNSLKDFIYDRLEKIDAKVLENSKNANEQIEKNAELFFKISKNSEELKSDLQKSLFEMSEKLVKNISKSLEEQKERIGKDMDKLSLNVEKRLDEINEKVEKRLQKGFENIDKTFKDIIVGIAKIGEAQKKIESLSSEVNSLQSVLTDKKSRGIFGEVQLNSILKSIFGEKRDLYDLQYRFQSGVIADAVIKAPQPMGLICIDSKFPMENYIKMREDSGFAGEFKQNIKKHINDIASKYIIPSLTSDMAILFLPAEAIFAEINAYHEDLIEYGRKKGVWIASPTTLMALLTTILAITRDIKTQEQAKKIQEELLKLSQNFKRYRQRWENLAKHIDTVHKDVKEITTTTNKISDEFDKIERVDFDKLEDKK